MIKKWMGEILKFVLMGFVIIIGLSLAYGTTSFNKYCLQAQSGDWGGALTFLGSDRSGFYGCNINTLTLSTPVLFFGTFLLQYAAQIYLIAMLRKRSYLLHIGTTVVILLVLTLLCYVLTSLLPRMTPHFLDGHISVRKEPLFILPPIISPSELLSVSFTSILRQLIFILYAAVLLFSGPLTAMWLVKKFSVRLKLKSRLKLFICTAAISIFAQIVFIIVMQLVLLSTLTPFQPPQLDIQNKNQDQ